MMSKTLCWWPEKKQFLPKMYLFHVRPKNITPGHVALKVLLALVKNFGSSLVSPLQLRRLLKGGGPMGQRHSQRSPGAGCVAACLTVMYAALQEGSS